jgi:hypothetical protein
MAFPREGRLPDVVLYDAVRLDLDGGEEISRLIAAHMTAIW